MTLKGEFHFYMLTNTCWIGWSFGKFTRVAFGLDAYHQATLSPLNFFKKWIVTHDISILLLAVNELQASLASGFTFCIGCELIVRSMFLIVFIPLSSLGLSLCPCTTDYSHLHIVHVLTCKMQQVMDLKHRHQNMTPK